jgi:uncharacterized protein (DUF3820 family)
MKLEEYRRLLAASKPEKHAKSKKAMDMKPYMGDKYTISADGSDFVILFGKYKGSKGTDLEDFYLKWLIENFSKPEKKKFFQDLVDISQHILDTREMLRAAKAFK